MKQNFTFSRFVLSELNYTDNEIKQIIETLQRGDFAYVEKKDYQAIRDNDIWRQDNVSGIDVPVLWTPDTGITNETIFYIIFLTVISKPHNCQTERKKVGV